MQSFIKLLEDAKAKKLSATVYLSSGQNFRGDVVEVDSGAGVVCLNNPSHASMWILLERIVAVHLPPLP